MEIKYIHDTLVHNTNAAEQIVPQLIKDFRPQSVVDVGCGIGTWLKVFKTYGIQDFLGIDGENVNRNLLMIEDENFLSVDLSHPLNFQRRFDIAISLEVAEHLPEECADIFIKTLTNLSDTVFFSAAIPGQGGQNHVNEQYPDYWGKIFLKYGYGITGNYSQMFWNNNKVEWWYRQNMIVYRKQNISNQSTELNVYIHPELYKKKLEEIEYLKLEKRNVYGGKIPIIQGLKIFYKSFRNSLRSRK
ncbi:MAG: class I SAM-dependent methyltransferase [Bacteroidota bacterium]|nr:class I SAM-dependent methyltransferase [Bacteroidota bacterium]